MIEALGLKTVILDDSPLIVSDSEMRRCTDPLDLATEKAAALVSRIVDRELDARRSGVDHRDAASHVGLSWLKIGERVGRNGAPRGDASV
jgi:hypothetical protein